MKSTKIDSITFITEARVTQSIVILEDNLTLEEIKDGFRAGLYITSIDYNTDENTEEFICRINSDESLTRVALIKSQQAEGDISVYI